MLHLCGIEEHSGWGRHPGTDSSPDGSTDYSHSPRMREVSATLDRHRGHARSDSGTDQETQQGVSAASWRIESPYCGDCIPAVLPAFLIDVSQHDDLLISPHELRFRNLFVFVRHEDHGRALVKTAQRVPLCIGSGSLARHRGRERRETTAQEGDRYHCSSSHWDIVRQPGARHKQIRLPLGSETLVGYPADRHCYTLLP